MTTPSFKIDFVEAYKHIFTDSETYNVFFTVTLKHKTFRGKAKVYLDQGKIRLSDYRPLDAYTTEQFSFFLPREDAEKMTREIVEACIDACKRVGPENYV